MPHVFPGGVFYPPDIPLFYREEAVIFFIRSAAKSRQRGTWKNVFHSTSFPIKLLSFQGKPYRKLPIEIIRKKLIADNYFRSGDRVRHFKGAKLIVKANPAEDDDNLLCPLCGKMVLTPKCSFCRIRFDIPSQS